MAAPLSTQNLQSSRLHVIPEDVSRQINNGVRSLFPQIESYLLHGTLDLLKRINGARPT